MGRRRNRPLNADAARALDRLKYEVAQEIGYVRGGGPPDQVFRQNLDRMKFEVADERVSSTRSTPSVGAT